MKSPDAGRENVVGVALAKLNQWGFGTVSFDPEGQRSEVSANDVGAPRVMPVALAKGGAPGAVAEQVRTIREDLEDANKAGKIKTKEDALDYVERKAMALGWNVGEQIRDGGGAVNTTRPGGNSGKGRELRAPLTGGAVPKSREEPPAELRRAPLRAQAEKMAREAEDNFELIEAPTDLREALEANVEKTRRAYDELRITFPEGTEEFETAARGIDAVHEKEKAAILDAYRQKAEEPKRRVNQVLNDPEFTKLPPQQRGERLEQVISEAANSYHGKWDRGAWMDWTDFSQRAWERAAPSAMESVKESGSKVVNGVGRMFVDIPRSFRDQGAAIWDELETYTKTGKHGELARTGKDAFEAQFLQWDAAAGQFFNRVLTDDQKTVNEAIERLLASVDTGEFLDDPSAFQKRADEVTQAQLAWWGKMAPVTTEVSAEGNTYIERRPVGALEWGMSEKEAARRNGVFAPDNAMLLLSYMTTHNPALKEQLRSQLLRTPDVIHANDKLEAAMRSPGAVAYEAIHGKGTAANFVSAMDPVTVVGNVALACGAIKGALGVARAVAGETAGATAAREFAKGTARSSAVMGTLGAANVIKDDPNASPGAILAGGAEGAATGALFHSALAAAGFTGGKVLSRLRDGEAKARSVEGAGSNGRSEPLPVHYSEAPENAASKSSTERSVPVSDAKDVLEESKAEPPAASHPENTKPATALPEPRVESPALRESESGKEKLPPVTENRVPASAPAPVVPPPERPGPPSVPGQGTVIDRVRAQTSVAGARDELKADAPMPGDVLQPLQRTYAKALESLPPEGAPAILPKPGHAIADPAESRRFLDEKLAEVKPSAPAVTFKLGGGFEGRLSLPSSEHGDVDPLRVVKNTRGEPGHGTPVLEIVHESDPRHVLLERPVGSGEQAQKALSGLRDTLRMDRAAIEEELARGQQAGNSAARTGDEGQGRSTAGELQLAQAKFPHGSGAQSTGSSSPATEVTRENFANSALSSVRPDFSVVAKKAVAEIAKTAERGKGNLKEEPGDLHPAWSLRKRSKLSESDHAQLDAKRAKFDRSELFKDVGDIWEHAPGKVRRLIEAETMKFDGSSNESFRTTVGKAIGRELRKDRAFLKGFRWGGYLKNHLGPTPLVDGKEMDDPHSHHFIFKQWLETQDPLVREAHQLLWDAGIDPLFGLENLGWAPQRVKGQHTTANLHEMVATLRKLKEAGLGYNDFVSVLTHFGSIAATRTKSRK